MLEALIHTLQFLMQTAIVVVAIIAVAIFIFALTSKCDEKETLLQVKKLNKYYGKLSNAIKKEILSKKEYKKHLKEKKSIKKKLNKRAFVLNFNGDKRASAVDCLREEITAILNIATPEDEVIVKLESPGGELSSYGLGISQLIRLRDKNIPLTIAIDKVAASGGYFMACVANQIIAAPFSTVGSLGVVIEIPNFHRLLKKMNIDYEQITSGEFKRTLSLFGENTSKGRKKMEAQAISAHEILKALVKQFRTDIDIDTVSTGDFWLASEAIKYHLVDKLMSSDEYLTMLSTNTNLYEIKFQKKKKIHEKLLSQTQSSFKKWFGKNSLLD